MFKQRSITPYCFFISLIMAALLAGCCCAGSMDDEDIDLNLVTDQPAPPVAVVAADPADEVNSLSVAFDASASYDTDGTIVRYDWDFDSDGTYDLDDGGATPTHTYDDNGEYTATVRVTDNDGLNDTASTSPFTIPAVTAPPEAQGSATQDPENPLAANLDASDSFDTDGTIVQYDWDMDNDGVFEIIDGGPNPSHVFDDYGSFTVGVRVTDDDGLQDTALITGMLSAPPADEPPVANLVANPTSGNAPGLEVTWDASGSTDSDGTIVRYNWDMDNDGSYEVADGGETQAATYDAGGIYTVGVLVTDDDGLTDSTTADCDVNVPPVAVINVVPDSGLYPLTTAIDGVGSNDPDGVITDYEWDFDGNGIYNEVGDEAAARGSVGPHNVTYSVDGTYTAALRVTDDSIPVGTDVATHDIQVFTENDHFSITVNLTVRDLSLWNINPKSLVRLYNGDPAGTGVPITQFQADHEAAGDGNPATVVFEGVSIGSDYWIRIINIVVHWDGDATPLNVKEMGPYEGPSNQVIDLAGAQWREPPGPE